MKRYISFLFAGFLGLCFMSCEGPAGPAGIDGIDGQDGANGEVTCLVCHSSDNIQAVTEQFSQSVHSAGQVAVDYAGGRSSCAQCHSSEGFIEFARNGSVGENISAPSAWECKTCHSIHSTFEGTDYALRLAEPIKFMFDNTTTVDFGNSNLCANCHQQRRAEPNVSNPGTTFAITSTHYGPHYGTQSNVLYGVGFAEITGSIAYPTAGSGKHMTEADGKCVGCHMDTYADGEGGHTWNPSLNACNTCHNASETDFNHGNVQTETQLLLDELQALLLAQGVIEEGIDTVWVLNPETGLHEQEITSDGFHPVVGTHTMVRAQAFFNWDGIVEDRSLGVHNPGYVKAILTNTIEALSAK